LESPHRLQTFFIFRSIGIIGLEKIPAKSLSLKDLFLKYSGIRTWRCQVAEFQGSKVAIWRGLAFPAPIRKGAGIDLHPFSFFYTSIISVSPSLPDRLCNFIFLADSLAYAENRRNGGLTRFRRNERRDRDSHAGSSPRALGVCLLKTPVTGSMSTNAWLRQLSWPPRASTV